MFSSLLHDLYLGLIFDICYLDRPGSIELIFFTELIWKFFFSFFFLQFLSSLSDFDLAI
jgi:hypothetical protein